MEVSHIHNYNKVKSHNYHKKGVKSYEKTEEGETIST